MGTSPLSSSGSNYTLTVNATTAAATIGTVTGGAYGNMTTFSGTNNVTLGNYNQFSNGNDGFTVSGANLTITGATTAASANRTSGTFSVLLNSGTLNLNHAGILTNVNSSTGNSFTINGGTLNNTSGAALTESGNPAITLGGDFIFGGTNALNLGTGTVTLSASRQITTNGSAALTLGGSITGTGFGLTKTGPSTLILTGASTYSGGTTVNGGTLDLAHANPSNLGTGAIRGTLTINNGATVLASVQNALGYTAGIETTSVDINGGTLNNTSTGDQGWGTTFNLTGATLTSNGGVSSGTAASNFTLGKNSGGAVAVNTLASATTSTIAGHLKLDAGNGNSAVTFTVADGAAATDLLISAAITPGNGTVGITKAGAGALLLSGVNLYTGPTTIDNGTLALSGNGSLHDTTLVSLTSATSSFSIAGINAASETVGSITGVATSQINLGGKELIVGGDNSSFSEAGDISGSGGSLTKSGTGTMTLGGSNTYSSNTDLNAGTLLLGSSTALPANAKLNLSTGTTLNTGGNSASTGQLNVTGNAVINLSTGSSSALTFADAGIWSGILSIWNYTGGAAWAASLGDKLTFTSQGSIDLSKVNFYSDSGITMVGTGGAGFITGNELVPVPEPGAVSATLLLLGVISYRRRRA